MSKITVEQQYHGAVIAQIAELPLFTAVNTYRSGGRAARSAYVVNNNIAIHVKYGSDPSPPYGEYTFTYTEENVNELETLDGQFEKVYVCLICVVDKEICAVPCSKILKMVALRRKAAGYSGQCNVLVTVGQNQPFSVYANVPGTKRKLLGRVSVPRNSFPDCLFGK